MKVKPSVKPICEKCKVIRRKGRAPDAKRPPVSGRPWGMLCRFTYFRQKVSGSKSGSSQKRVMISV